MKTIFLIAILALPSLAKADKTASCLCYYGYEEGYGWNRTIWEFVGIVEFVTNRENYQEVGRAACLKSARELVLDSKWNQELVDIDNCRFRAD